MAYGSLNYTTPQGCRLTFRGENKDSLKLLRTFEKKFTELRAKKEIVINTATIHIMEKMETVFSKYFKEPYGWVDKFSLLDNEIIKRS